MAVPSIFDTWCKSVVIGLDQPDCELRLQRWLEGYSLPPIDSYTQGHAWLLKAVDKNPDLGDKLTPPAAKLLEQYRQLHLESQDSNRLLFNLFYLCHGLRRPEVLWTPLHAIWQDILDDRINLTIIHYRGISAITAFRAALAENQYDDTLLPVWRDMLDGSPNRYLRGAPMDGFEGILGLPDIRREVPIEVWVGWALARMADYLDDSRFREEQFKGLLEHVRNRFNDPSWNFDVLAERCGWKSWTSKLVGEPASLITIKYSDVIHLWYDPKTREMILPVKYSDPKIPVEDERLLRQMTLLRQMARECEPHEFVKLKSKEVSQAMQCAVGACD